MSADAQTMSDVNTEAIPIDEAAFAAMLHDNAAAMTRLARHYAGPEDWQDLRQEMHLQLWRSFATFDGRAERSTWVYRVALNTALSYRRKPRPAHEPLTPQVEPADAGAAHGELAVLEQFLATLDPVQRSVLLLDLEGLDREQIAAVLGLSPNAVAIRMTRLRQAFETQFLEQG